MGLIDFILNLAGLLLWLNWRATKADPLGARKPATLLGTLRRAEPSRWRRWHLPAALGGLLLLRAVFYWQIGSTTTPVWSGKLDLGISVPSFISSSFVQMLLFSFFSFGLTLGIFYLWLLFLSIVSDRNAESEPIRQLVHVQLGVIDRWPRLLKLFLPLVITMLVWWMASWLFDPKQISSLRRAEESLLVGLGSYLTWKFIAVAVLVLHLLNTYVYFGPHPFWNYVNGAARTLLKPLRKLPLQMGKMDFAPVVEIALIFFIAELAERGLGALYGRLPL
ncbi:MAG: hypothetical protein ABSG87_02280 [Verrucomicrobiota bacterium]|jgi:uncharacterized protein YggT (Ycf19 family)